MAKRTCSIPDCDRDSYCRGWCRMHYSRWWKTGDPVTTFKRLKTGIDRFLRHVEWSDNRFEGTRCLVWAGPLARGYGYLIDDDGVRVKAHRWSYERWVAPIPEGFHIDHLCHNADTNCSGGDECPHRACVNPLHVEPVTQAENNRRIGGGVHHNARKTHCKWGHEFTPENTHVPPNRPTQRVCRICRRDRERRAARRRKETAG